MHSALITKVLVTLHSSKRMTRIPTKQGGSRSYVLIHEIPCHMTHPSIRLPCKPHIAAFLYALYNQQPDTIIGMGYKSVLYLVLLPHTLSAEAYTEAQTEAYIEQYTSHLRISFPPAHNFYLTDKSIIEINDFLDAWFTEFCVALIIQQREIGIQEKETAQLLIQRYNIDSLSLEGLIKRSQMFRRRLNTGIYYRPQRKKVV